MALYGIYGSQMTDFCPLNNAQSRKIVLKMAAQKGLDNMAIKNKTKMLEQYHSIGTHISLDSRFRKRRFGRELYD